jgi:hypothetical protein
MAGVGINRGEALDGLRLRFDFCLSLHQPVVYRAVSDDSVNKCSDRVAVNKSRARERGREGERLARVSVNKSRESSRRTDVGRVSGLPSSRAG